MARVQPRKGEGLTEKKYLNKNLETPQLAPALFSHLPGFYLITGILNPSPFLGSTILIQNPNRYNCSTIARAATL